MPNVAEQRALARATTPLVATIAKTVDLHSERSEMRGACPLHSDSSRGLYVSPNGQFHCFSCGTGGDVVDWTMRVEGVAEAAAIDLLLGGQSSATD